MIASFVFAACLFVGWVPGAVYTADIKDLREQCETYDPPVTALCNQLEDVERSMTAAAVSCAANIQEVQLFYVSLDIWSLFNVGIFSTGHLHDSFHTE